MSTKQTVSKVVVKKTTKAKESKKGFMSESQVIFKQYGYLNEAQDYREDQEKSATRLTYEDHKRYFEENPDQLKALQKHYTAIDDIMYNEVQWIIEERKANSKSAKDEEIAKLKRKIAKLEKANKKA